MKWDESEHPRDSNGKFKQKTDPELLKALCKAFGVKYDANARRNVKLAIHQSMKSLSDKSHSQQNIKPKFHINSPPVRAIHSAIRISQEHYSRLSVMWSDYNIGACKPFKNSTGIYFNVDNSIYLTQGEYPWFYVVRALHFRSTYSLERYLKRRWKI